MTLYFALSDLFASYMNSADGAWIVSFLLTALNYLNHEAAEKSIVQWGNYVL